MVKIQNFKYHERGLNRFFGPLEAKIMNILWNGSSMTIKDVQAKLEEDKTLNFNTVMTVMNRLVDKDMLTKKTIGRTTLFQPSVSKDHFLENQSKELTHELIEEFGALVVNHMLDALEEVDEDLLAKLEQKIKMLKKDN
ncbi:BlaI/MecI/CopY family transcriptional regulator [Paenibacillus agricola]|uniref:BlaI/MecI/CopY family transcriptional regulator n=1 Tax=Paenibacillus agricola TaxID=2716264 RepID=A0ABX0J9K5_9BACL|nr:BlaI/MecI/CopY family transcriptional regulator [Paenibacillus agricola]NHN32451.1 BlaI/MecI/CopY family transcriptional regulator [Paenibacillus agricola]